MLASNSFQNREETKLSVQGISEGSLENSPPETLNLERGFLGNGRRKENKQTESKWSFSFASSCKTLTTQRCFSLIGKHFPPPPPIFEEEENSLFFFFAQSGLSWHKFLNFPPSKMSNIFADTKNKFSSVRQAKVFQPRADEFPPKRKL